VKSLAVIFIFVLSLIDTSAQSLDPKYYVFGTFIDYSAGVRRGSFSTNIGRSKFEVWYKPSRWQFPEMRRMEEVTGLPFKPESWKEGCKYCDTVYKLEVTDSSWKLNKFYKCKRYLLFETKSHNELKKRVWNWKCEFRKKVVLNATRLQKLSYLAGVGYRLENVAKDTITLELLEAPVKMECVTELLIEFGCTILSNEQTKLKHSSIGNNLYSVSFIPTDEIFNLLNEGVERKKLFTNTSNHYRGPW